MLVFCRTSCWSVSPSAQMPLSHRLIRWRFASLVRCCGREISRSPRVRITWGSVTSRRHSSEMSATFKLQRCRLAQSMVATYMEATTLWIGSGASKQQCCSLEKAMIILSAPLDPSKWQDTLCNYLSRARSLRTERSGSESLLELRPQI